MLQKLQSWLVRQRDQSAVSYSRFGRPGDEEEDKPPPTTIVVAPFNENAPEFFLFGSCHVQKAAIYFAAFGMSITILMFISTFFEFDWYHHKRGVDVGAVIGLFLYLAIGVLIHYYVIIGVKKQLSRYLLPFICVYTIICVTETCMCIGLLFKLLDAQVTEPHHRVHIQMDVYYHSTTTTTPPYAAILFGLFIVLAVQFLMLVGVLRCRQFLSAKQEHEMAMKVAEMSKTQYPTIQVVFASSGSGTGPFRNPAPQNGIILNPPPIFNLSSTTANNYSSPIPQTPFHNKNDDDSSNSSPTTASNTSPIPPTPSHNNSNKQSNEPPMENIII